MNSYTAFCLCGHHSDQHDLDGECAMCECMEFEPSELLSAQESPQLEE